MKAIPLEAQPVLLTKLAKTNCAVSLGVVRGFLRVGEGGPTGWVLLRVRRLGLLGMKGGNSIRRTLLRLEVFGHSS